jgi:hypothetical protein
MSRSRNRRVFLKSSLVGAAAAAGISVSETAAVNVPPIVEKGMPMGRLGKLWVSRLFIGSNQVSGYAHARDLRYVPGLMRAYQTDERVLDTWQLCEELGINTVLSDPFERPVKLMAKYRKERGGRLQWLSEIHPAKPYHEVSLADMKQNLRQVVDNGADLIYVQGGIGDSFVMRKAVEDLDELLEDMKATGLPSGIGAHSIETVKAVAAAGIRPDFFFKTYHSGDYWSPTPVDQRVEFNVDSGSPNDHDNIWCIKPEETREVMGRLEAPWIAFKVLAAGALDPRKAFRFAFEGGADFICVGMFDFQLREDVRIARETLSADLARQRPWRA